MAFWTDHTGQDPKRNFRFIATIGNMPDGATWYCKSAQKPAFTVADVSHSFLNHTFYYPGKVEWQTIAMTLVDPLDPGSLYRFNQSIRSAGYRIPGDANVLTTQSKKKATTSLGAVKILQIDGDGNEVETWTLQNPFLKKISFSELDYENDDLSTIDIELRYDWAECLTVDGEDAATFYKAQ